MKNSFVNIALFVFVAALSAPAQALKKEEPPIRITANLMVLDDKDRYIADVKAEDIVLFENDVEQEIESFHSRPADLSLAIVVDNSGSIRTLVGKVVRAAGIIATNLGPGDEAMLIRFVGRDKIEILQDWTFERNHLLEGVENLYIDGGQTAVIDAVYLSLEKVLEKKKLQAARRYAVVLISDSADRSSYYSPAQLLTLATNSGVQVFSLAMTGELSDKRDPVTKIRNTKTNAENLVHQLAFRTGGNAYLLGRNFSESALIDALRSIMVELRSQYVFSYVSTNSARDDLPRKLRVEFKDSETGKNKKIAARESVLVPRDILTK